MGMRWRIRPVHTATAIEEGVAHEPFAFDAENNVIYTREQYFEEADEPRSSTHQPNFAGNEPDDIAK